MSSMNYGDTNDYTGVLDENPELSPLAKAHKAYVPYCSSDSHMGDAAHTWNFRGQRIVAAVFEHLKQH